MNVKNLFIVYDIFLLVWNFQLTWIYLGRPPWTPNHKSNKIYIFDI